MQDQQIFKDLLLVSDIDGTLTELMDVPKKNIEAIKRFISLGGKFTLCTGRPKCALREVLEQVPINAPMITINGSYLYSPDEGVLYEVRLPDGVKDFVYLLLERFPQIGAMLVEPESYWVIRWGDESIEGLWQRKEMYEKQGCCRMYSPQEGPQSWHKVVLMISPEQIPTVRAFIEQQNPKGFYPVQSDRFYLELVSDEANKGKGMNMIRDALHMKKTAAIGDRENDESMLLEADFSAIPKNGDENLRKKVDFIVDSCENGAVADFINHLEQIYNR